MTTTAAKFILIIAKPANISPAHKAAFFAKPNGWMRKTEKQGIGAIYTTSGDSFVVVATAKTPEQAAYLTKRGFQEAQA